MAQTPDSPTAITITVLSALAGYIATYVNSLRLEQRKAQITRVDQQLRELYGPLLALVHSSDEAWKGFCSIYKPQHGAFFGGKNKPSDKELAAWRLWMQEVFMPQNEAMVKLLTDHTDLLEESEIPACLLKLCAHVSAYKPVLKAWDNHDYSCHTSVINYPDEELLLYARERFNQLKKKQADLMGSEQGIQWRKLLKRLGSFRIRRKVNRSVASIT